MTADLEATYDFDSLSHEYALEKAKSLDATIDIADSKTLQLDLDNSSAFHDTFFDQYRLVKELGLIHEAKGAEPEIRRSKSGNYHVVIKLDRPLPVEQRIMLQLILGSDRVRETLSLARVRLDHPYPILLFVPNVPWKEPEPADDDLLF